MKNWVIVFLFLLNSFYCISQSDSSKWSLSGYGEIYYSFDFSNPQYHTKPDFIYNHKRHNELNLNLAYLKASYIENYFRANIAAMIGTYAQYNLSSEPNWAQFIYEANLGLKLSKSHNLWLDAGIFPSHIGFESAVSADCWTLTRSLLAENSPYYETGLRLSHTSKKENLYWAILLLNGWQHIRRPDGIQRPSMGFQINYKPRENILLNYSNFIGTDKPDSLNAWRVFHNLYTQIDISKKWSTTLGFDIGMDKFDTQYYGWWFSPVAIIRYQFHTKSKLALRGEYYHDKNHIIVNSLLGNGFALWGLSANYDYEWLKNLLWRVEIKYYQADEAIFDLQRNNISMTTSLSYRF